MSAFKDIKGNQYGRWTVIEEAGRGKHRQKLWRCRCDCGEERAVSGMLLRRGDSKSCGCLKREQVPDETGKIYGHLTVVERAGSNKRGFVRWLCHCDCGNEKIVLGKYLRSGVSSSCGCLRPKNLALAGIRFGSWTVLKRVGSNKHGSVRWLCRCDCSLEKIVLGNSLKRGESKSCGCINRLRGGEANFNVVFGDYKKSAKIRGLVFELSKEQFRGLIEGDCSYCGIKPSRIVLAKRSAAPYTCNGIDRLDNEIGYTLNNCIPCCGICNKAKRDLSLDEFTSWLRRISPRWCECATTPQDSTAKLVGSSGLEPERFRL